MIFALFLSTIMAAIGLWGLYFRKTGLQSVLLLLLLATTFFVINSQHQFGSRTGGSERSEEERISPARRLKNEQQPAGSSVGKENPRNVGASKNENIGSSSVVVEPRDERSPGLLMTNEVNKPDQDPNNVFSAFNGLKWVYLFIFLGVLAESIFFRFRQDQVSETVDLFMKNPKGMILKYGAVSFFTSLAALGLAACVLLLGSLESITALQGLPRYQLAFYSGFCWKTLIRKKS